MIKNIKLLGLALICIFAISLKVNAINVNNLEELMGAVQNSSDIVLQGDITINPTDAQLIISQDVVVNIDLNNHTLTANSTGTRKIINNGTLILKNGTVKNEGTTAYGIIDSYGKITLNSVIFRDYGCGNGSTVKIRPGSTGTTVDNSKFYNEGITTGNAGMYIDGTATVKNSTFESKSDRAYALIVNSGSATIKNVIIDGTHGGISVNSGNVIIESGTFSAKNYYGIWITNNYNNTNVTINGGTFNGLYGLYSSIDDGNQDDGNVTVTINGGIFNGNSKPAMAINTKNSENTWAVDVTGGTFNSDINKYVDTDKSIIYTLGEGALKKYVVVTNVFVDVDPEDKIDEKSDTIIEDFLTDIINKSITDEAIKGVSEDMNNKIKESIALNKKISSKIIINEVEDNNEKPTKLSSNSKIAGYFDIEIAVFADDDKIGTINELDKKIKINLELPDNLPTLKKGFTRKYSITRIHDGKEEQLESKVEGNNISFESDRYSTFILSYVDVEANPSNPNTYDGITLYTIIGLIGIIGSAVVVNKLKRNN